MKYKHAEIRTGGVDAIAGVDSVEAVLSEGSVTAVDGVAIIGNRVPNVGGIELKKGRSGGILVDEGMNSSAKQVYAAGDCVEVSRGASSLSFRTESCATIMGKVAATNALGGDAEAALSGVISDELFGVEVCYAGMASTEAIRLGLDAKNVALSFPGRHAGFGGESIVCSITFDRVSGVVCGLQAVGWKATTYSALFSFCLSRRATLKDLASFDAGYYPAVSAGMSPISLTAEEAMSASRR